MHTTNYTNALILPSEDCRAARATIPETHGSIARMQYDHLAAAPYALTSDDLILAVQGARKGVDADDPPTGPSSSPRAKPACAPRRS